MPRNASKESGGSSAKRRGAKGSKLREILSESALKYEARLRANEQRTTAASAAMAEITRDVPSQSRKLSSEIDRQAAEIKETAALMAIDET